MLNHPQPLIHLHLGIKPEKKPVKAKDMDNVSAKLSVMVSVDCSTVVVAGPRLVEMYVRRMVTHPRLEVSQEKMCAKATDTG